MKLKMFVCGPTVYDYIHLGNARTLVFFDVAAKWLRHQGADLEYIQNITDIEDKILVRAKEQGREPQEFAREWEQKFYEDAKALGITSPIYKRATDHIPEVLSQVKRLIEKGCVYEIGNDGFYFDLSKFPDYGKLSGRTDIKDDDAVSRIDENEHKRNKGDFCVWKGDFETGRPGWHIEDTAITEKYFGPQYDIHGGGIDLMFPHHEAEIAIMRSISGQERFVDYWMHTGFLVNKGARMGKSVGNFTTVHEALKHHSPEAIRHYFLSSHYRSPLEYGENAIAPSEAAVTRLGEFYNKLRYIKTSHYNASFVGMRYDLDKTQNEFINAMDGDFNTSRAIATLFDFVSNISSLIARGEVETTSAIPILNFLEQINNVLGIIPISHDEITSEIARLLEAREHAKNSGNFMDSDIIRNTLSDLEWDVEDTKYGQIPKKKKHLPSLM